MENERLQIPVNAPSPPRSAMPSSGLQLAVVAGAIGQFVASALRHFGVWDMDTETQSSLTGITMAAIIYIHERTRK
jgi:hypothetical protein